MDERGREREREREGKQQGLSDLTLCHVVKRTLWLWYVVFSPTKSKPFSHRSALGAPEWSTGLGWCHLHQGIAHREGAQEDSDQEEAEVEVDGGGHPEEGAGRLVEEVDSPRPAVEEEDVLHETDPREEGAEEDTQPERRERGRGREGVSV